MKKYQNQIEIILRTIITNKKKILLCHNPKDPPPFYYLLGGHMEKGETLEKCLNRELQEEIGIKAKKVKLLGIFENFFKDWEGSHQEINFLYEATVAMDPKSITSHEKHIKLEWVDIDKLNNTRLLPENIKRFLLKYFSG